MSSSLPAVLDRADDPIHNLVLAWLAGQRSVHTRRAYIRDIGSWRAWCSGHRQNPLTADELMVASWARRLESGGLAASTAARKLSAVSSWYTWLARNQHTTGNPAKHVARPSVDRDTSATAGLTRDQAVALLGAADTDHGSRRARTSALVALLLFTGARVSEVCGADIEDLGADRGHRVVRVTRKGGKRQALAMPPPAAERLDAYLATRDDMASLPALRGQPSGPRPRRPLFTTETGGRLFPADVWKLIRRLGRAAGLPAELVAHLGVHSMRHSFATLYLDSGGSLRDLQDAMGHVDPRTTRRYDRARYSLDRSPGYALASYLTPD